MSDMEKNRPPFELGDHVMRKNEMPAGRVYEVVGCYPFEHIEPIGNRPVAAKPDWVVECEMGNGSIDIMAEKLQIIMAKSFSDRIKSGLYNNNPVKPD